MGRRSCEGAFGDACAEAPVGACWMEGWLPDVLMTYAHALGKRLNRLVEADADVVRHAVWVSVWGRWYIWLVGVGMLAYRPSLWYPEDIGYLFLNVSLATINGVVHFRLLTNRPVTWRWMLAISAMDVALITANIVVSGRFDNFIFIIYYPALSLFAVVFISFWMNMAWTTMVAAAHTVVSVVSGSGLDLGAGDERALIARVAAMYLVVAGIVLIAGFERNRRRAAMGRERQLQQERIELSRAIHDTTAQTVYMIGLGIEGAMRLAGDSNPKLVERLAATAALSRSAMWELRKPIDVGRIFEGRGLARVLGAHTATFSTITSVPAEMVQSGAGAAAVHGGADRSLLHRAQRSGQRLPARAGREGRGQAGFRRRRRSPVRLGRWNRAAGRLRRARPGLQRHGDGYGTNGRQAYRGIGRTWRRDHHNLCRPPCFLRNRRLRCHRPTE